MTKPKPKDMRMERKRLFIRALAEYLAGDVGRKSIELEMGTPSAKEWYKLRNATPLFGYSSEAEAEAELTEFLK